MICCNLTEVPPLENHLLLFGTESPESFGVKPVIGTHTVCSVLGSLLIWKSSWNYIYESIGLWLDFSYKWNQATGSEGFTLLSKVQELRFIHITFTTSRASSGVISVLEWIFECHDLTKKTSRGPTCGCNGKARLGLAKRSCFGREGWMSHQIEVVILYPKASMYGICTYIWLNCMVKSR